MENPVLGSCYGATGQTVCIFMLTITTPLKAYFESRLPHGSPLFTQWNNEAVEQENIISMYT